MMVIIISICGHCYNPCFHTFGGSSGPCEVSEFLTDLGRHLSLITDDIREMSRRYTHSSRKMMIL